MTLPDIHVVIVNYRSAAYTTKCVESLVEEPISSITIVDNDSGDMDRTQIEDIVREVPNARAIFQSHNSGFGAGANRGVESLEGASEHDLVWILNPDTLVSRGAARTLAENAKRGSRIVSPQITTGSAGDRVWFAGGDVDPARGHVSHWGYGQEVRETDRIFECTFITGAAPMMTIETWRELGGFREDLFLYWEDVDMSLRAKRRGVTLMLVPSARVWHLEGGSSGEPSGRSKTFYYYFCKNRIVVCSDYATIQQVILGSGFVDTVRSLLRPLREREQRFGKLASALSGTLAAIAEAFRSPR